MFRSLRALFTAVVAASGLAVIALPAAAQTTIDYSTGTATAGYNMGFGSGTGQTFTVPANVTHLVSVSLGVSQNAGVRNYNLSLYRISGDTVGVLIQTSPETISAGAAYPTYELDTLTLTGSGLSVTPGETFLITGITAGPINAFTVARDPGVYAGGSTYSNTTSVTGDAFFRAVFTDAVAPPPTPVPTLTEWAMLAFGLVLAGGAALYLQPRRRVA